MDYGGDKTLIDALRHARMPSSVPGPGPWGRVTHHPSTFDAMIELYVQARVDTETKKLRDELEKETKKARENWDALARATRAEDQVRRLTYDLKLTARALSISLSVGDVIAGFARFDGRSVPLPGTNLPASGPGSPAPWGPRTSPRTRSWP